MNNYNIVFFIFINLFFGSCCKGVESEGQYFDSPKIADTLGVNNVIGDTDTCFIKLDVVSQDSIFDCSSLLFVLNDSIIYSIENEEYNWILYKIKKTKSEDFFEYDLYDSPTGRRKLLLVDVKNRNIYQSDFFDNEALGDQIIFESIVVGNNTFKVKSMSSPNHSKEYDVSMRIIKSW